ncbi:MAG: UBP-type zinc finger domain-containing protein [Gammaproteobacteria bacterium]
MSYTEHVFPECVAKGDTWVQLRICMACGRVGCCDSSKNRHLSAHYHSTGHPIIKTIGIEPDWTSCYPDNTYLRRLTRQSFSRRCHSGCATCAAADATLRMSSLSIKNPVGNILTLNVTACASFGGR